MPEKLRSENLEQLEQKERILKILFIDDNKEYLGDVENRFSGNSNIIIAECNSVEEALQAIEENNPDVVFLDHQLTSNGSEGIEILEKGAELLKDKKVYSTTLSKEMDIAIDYLKRDVEIIGKDLDKAEAIIKGKEKNDKEKSPQ